MNSYLIRSLAKQGFFLYLSSCGRKRYRKSRRIQQWIQQYKNCTVPNISCLCHDV